MAQIEKLIPFIIRWEAGGTQQKYETNGNFFSRRRKAGFANDPKDRGGATQTGITLATYTEYCKRKHISAPTVDNLKNIPYETWKDVLKTMYWDRWKADEIESQPVANILVDWVWASGRYGITKPQQLLGVVADGIVGKKTLAAVNGRSPLGLFGRIKQARLEFVENIVRANPSQKKWLQGWKNRINDIKYS